MVSQEEVSYHKIVLPTRSQPDTLVAIFILKRFGEAQFPGITNAEIDFWQVMPEKENSESLLKKGIIPIDIGGGAFDHHVAYKKVTASEMVAEYLGIKEDPALKKLLEYAERDDFYGKGTISSDPLDRAFGLSALVAALNKNFAKELTRVPQTILPILEAHYNEEARRTKELPEEFEKKVKNGEVDFFEARQRDKKLKGVMITSESPSFAGFLRSQNGGKFDVVAQWLPSGHVNILTRPTKHIDLRSLAMLLRLEEGAKAGKEFNATPHQLARTGRMPEIPEWYYDPATNSIQNGGLNPKEVSPTKISKKELLKILALGLSEKIWSPQSA